MAYRKRSLDLPVSEDSPASIKHPRSSTATSTSSNNTRPLQLSISTALEPPVSQAAANNYTGDSLLPPIRSLTGPVLASPSSSGSIPSFRHFHTPGGFGSSPVPSNVRHHQDTMPSLGAQSGLTASLSQLSHTRTATTTTSNQHPQSHPHHHYNPPPSAHYTYAPPLAQPILPPVYHHRPSVDQHHESSPISSTHSAGSPHTARRDLGHGGEALSQLESAEANAAESPLEAVKVARNWSRDETLSLVRAIKRHYEALKRCKTNQERSNVWHRIHKEHSSQFPGRSKKASQDRWGK
ncbi:hypothetical protein GGI21_006283, partial [Coemansia aciculifera]